MAESSFDAALQHWLADAPRRVETSAQGPGGEVWGRVESVADGVARVSGLPEARLGERLSFDGEIQGYVLTLEEDHLSCVLMDPAGTLGAGDRVYGSGDVVKVPVGQALLGRVIDPLGRPLDNGAAVAAEAQMPVERAAPAIHERDLVVEPVHTGVLAVDAMFALGRGQRELIVGDRATGKTALATDTIIAQKDSDLICVYVAVGQTTASTARVIDAIRQHGAPERCVFVVAGASTAPGLQWIAPFAGMSIAEWFRDRGQHALVVVDDLTKHAATHRELALLTRQPPGREAYPGDVFYVHSRLLERAAKLSPALNSGSLTALPICETQAGNLSGYIPTNLISITDGQWVLDRKLFDANHKPAIDTGLSVSRIGGKTQAATMRQAVGSLRLDYAQFLELEMFTRFGTAVEPRVQKRLDRGQHIRAMLNQPQYAPQPAAVQVALLHALNHGLLDALPVEALPKLRAALPGWLAAAGAPLARSVERDQKLDDAALAATVTALKTFVGGFVSAPVPAQDAPAATEPAGSGT